MKKLIDILLNHERYQTISFLVVLALLIWFLGCEPKTQSLIDPTQKVSRAQLDIEIDTIISKSNIAYASLEKQEKLREFLFQQAITAASTGTVNPIALMTSVGAILGLGATVDNIRKRKTVKELKSLLDH